MVFIEDIYGHSLNVALIESFIRGKSINYDMSVYQVTMASGATHEVCPDEFKKVPVETP